MPPVRHLVNLALVLLLVLGPLAGVPMTALAQESTPAGGDAGALDARLGGSQASFEAGYGTPANQSGTMAIYDAPGLSLLGVSYAGETAVQVALIPEEGSTWTREEALELANEFLPADARVFENRTYENVDENLVVPCRSDALGEVFTRAVYRENLRFGRVGDCQIELQQAGNGGVSAVLVEIGDGTPPRPLELDGPLTDEQRSYLNEVNSLLIEADIAVTRFYREAGKPEASRDVSILADAVYTWGAISDLAEGVTAPEGLEPIHEAFLEAMGGLGAAADEFSAAVGGDQAAAASWGATLRESNVRRAHLRYGVNALLDRDQASSSQPAVTHAGPPATDLDITAITLTTVDLQAVGVRTPFGLFRTGFLALDPFVDAWLGHQEGPPPAEHVVRGLTDAGWVRCYRSELALPPPQPRDGVVLVAAVVSEVVEYRDAEGAEAGFTRLFGEDVTFAADAVERPDLGDEAVVTTRRIGSDGEWIVHALRIRHGNLVLGLDVDVRSGGAPSPAFAEALGKRLIDRADAVRATGEPALGNKLLRLSGGAAPGAVRDAYVYIDGSTIPVFRETAKELRARTAGYAGATAAYDYILNIPAGLDDVAGDNTFYTARLFAFPSEAEAAAYLEGIAGRLRGQPAVTDVVDITGELRAGDAAIALRLDVRNDMGHRSTHTRVYARTAGIVIMLNVTGPRSSEAISGLRELTAVQMECLTAESCGGAAVPPAWTN